MRQQAETRHHYSSRLTQSMGPADPVNLRDATCTACRKWYEEFAEAPDGLCYDCKRKPTETEE